MFRISGNRPQRQHDEGGPFCSVFGKTTGDERRGE